MVIGNDLLYDVRNDRISSGVLEFKSQKKAYQNPALFGAGFQIISVLRRGTARLNWYLG
jgi:hypothetical protein